MISARVSPCRPAKATCSATNPGGPRADEQVPVYRPDLDDVRVRLRKMLAAMQADKLPADTLLVYRAIIPRMTGWLPADEAAQVRFDFEVELARLEAA